jgi:hypothetical protein
VRLDIGLAAEKYESIRSIASVFFRMIAIHPVEPDEGSLYGARHRFDIVAEL